MASTRTKIKIGIIGSDTSHTLAFIKEFKKYPHCEVLWIDANNRTDLTFSKERSPGIIKELEKQGIPLVQNLKEAKAVDAYCILTLDADTHLEILKSIEDDCKPVFIDKPIFYNLLDFEHTKQLIFSSSALRYTEFVRRAKDSIHLASSDIHIEGPLSFIDDIEGYFWYGIHLVEILHTLCPDNINIEQVEQRENYEYITGSCGSHKFSVKGIMIGDPEFKILINDERYSIKEDSTSIYANLVFEIVSFFKNKQSKTDGRDVIKTVLEINEKRREYA